MQNDLSERAVPRTATTSQESHPDNIVQRLQSRMDDAKRLGFRIRMELLDDEEATWCVIGNEKTMMIDLSQTAHEQLRQLDDALRSYAKVNESRSLQDKPRDSSGIRSAA